MRLINPLRTMSFRSASAGTFVPPVANANSGLIAGGVIGVLGLGTVAAFATLARYAFASQDAFITTLVIGAGIVSFASIVASSHFGAKGGIVPS